jgi:putative hemolysin
MRDLTTPRFRARLARDAGDVARAQGLRHIAFRGGKGERDCDPYDSAAQHMLIERLSGELVATFRVAVFDAGDGLGAAYAAQFYSLAPYAAQNGRKAEVGRFCLHPAHKDADALRLCWAALARLVLGQGVQHLFGCSSFAGADAHRHAPALAWLKGRALGPPNLRPQAHHPEQLPLGDAPADPSQIPPLLTFYLGLGGWVADHAIIDRDLDTLHVFTALDLAALSPARGRLLRALAS